MKFKFGKNSNFTKFFFKNLIDLMIPSDLSMDKASKVINLDNFLERVFENNIIVKKLKKFSGKSSIFSKKDIINLSSFFFQNKIIERDIEQILLEEYFSSKIIQKKLKKKFNKNV